MHWNLFNKYNVIVSGFAFFLFGSLYSIGSPFLFKSRYFFIIFLNACYVAEVFFKSILSMSVKSVIWVSLLKLQFRYHLKLHHYYNQLFVNCLFLEIQPFFSHSADILFVFFSDFLFVFAFDFFYNTIRS